MAADDEAELAAELLRTPPSEFVAARNAKVAELKAAGERELAARIAKLRRPRPAEWALNVVAHSDPDVIDAWAQVADAARAAQEDATGGKARTDLRGMLTDWRARTADVVAAAPDGAPTGELTALLTEIGGSADGTAALRAGLVGADTPTPAARPRKPSGRPEVEPKTPSEHPRGSSAKPAKPAKATGAAPQQKQRDKAAADRAESRRAEAAARLQEVAERVVEAEEQAATAAEAVAAAEAALQAAEAAVADAERALEAAEQHRRAARHDRADAERRQASAEERLERERRAHRAAAARLADADD